MQEHFRSPDPIDLRPPREQQPESLRICDEVRKEFMSVFSAENFSSIFQLFPKLPKSLQRCLASSLLLFGMQGCMYAPRYGEMFGQAAQNLDSSEIANREQTIRDLLADPTALTRTPALQSGIEPFQRERIFAHFSELIHQVSSEDFYRFIELCQTAKLAGIMNPDRYDPDFLRKVVDNYNNPELDREKPVILAIIARKDKQTFGIQALNVETYRLRELTRAYKVIVVETSAQSEIAHHIHSLSQREILRLGNLKGVIIAGHGSVGTIDVGLTVEEDFMKISQLNWYLTKNDEPSYVVFASCESGEGASQGFDGFSNFANRGALMFPQSQVLACNGYMTGIVFKTYHSSGKIVDESVCLRRVSDIFSSGDSTYRPQYNQILAHAVNVYSRQMGSNFPVVYLEFALRAGLINSRDILQAFNNGIDPFEFRLYLDCGLTYDDIRRYKQQNISAAQVYEYIRAGIYSQNLILDLARNRITPARFLAESRSRRY